MKRKAIALTLSSTFLISLLLIATVPSLKAVAEETQIEWQKTYDSLSGYSVVQTADEGYIIAGEQAAWKEFEPHSTSGWTNFTALLIKIDGSGNVQWKKTYGDEVGGGWTARSVVQTKDLGFAIIGLGMQEVFLIKTDVRGNIRWNTTVAWSGGTMLCDGIQTSDGGYLIAGTSEKEYPNQFGWILKTDENGNTLWNRTFGDSDTSAVAVAEADDGGYVVAGHWENDCWFAKTDVNGNVQWNRTYDFRFNDEIWYTYDATSIAKTADGGYILGGGNNNRGFLVKTNSEGVMDWNRSYEDDSAFTSIVQAANGDGYFAVGGFSYPSTDDVWFVRLDSSGDLLWDSTYNITRGDSRHQNAARFVVETSDGGYAVAGSLNGTVWLVKFAPESNALPDKTSPPPDYTPPLCPATLIVATVIIVTVVGAGSGLLVYLIKRK